MIFTPLDLKAYEPCLYSSHTTTLFTSNSRKRTPKNAQVKRKKGNDKMYAQKVIIPRDNKRYKRSVYIPKIPF